MTPRVLVGEDNPTCRAGVVAWLEAEGSPLLHAEKPAVGPRLATPEHSDLLLTQSPRPGTARHGAPRHLKADPATARIPGVAFTANVMWGDVLNARRAGWDGALTKVLGASVLREAPDRFLASGVAGSACRGIRGGRTRAA